MHYTSIKYHKHEAQSAICKSCKRLASKKYSNVGWEKCLTCQKDLSKKLRCPLITKCSNPQDIILALHGKFANTTAIKTILQMNLQVLSAANVLKETLLQHGAKYLNKSYEIFSNAKLEQMSTSCEENSNASATRLLADNQTILYYIWDI